MFTATRNRFIITRNQSSSNSFIWLKRHSETQSSGPTRNICHLIDSWIKSAITTARARASKRAFSLWYTAHYKMAIHHFNPTSREPPVSPSVQCRGALCLQSGHTQQHVHFAMTVFTSGVHKRSLPRAVLTKHEETLCWCTEHGLIGPHVFCIWRRRALCSLFVMLQQSQHADTDSKEKWELFARYVHFHAALFCKTSMTSPRGQH